MGWRSFEYSAWRTLLDRLTANLCEFIAWIFLLELVGSLLEPQRCTSLSAFQVDVNVFVGSCAHPILGCQRPTSWAAFSS